MDFASAEIASTETIRSRSDGSIALGVVGGVERGRDSNPRHSAWEEMRPPPASDWLNSACRSPACRAPRSHGSRSPGTSSRRSTRRWPGAGSLTGIPQLKSRERTRAWRWEHEEGRAGGAPISAKIREAGVSGRSQRRERCRVAGDDCEYPRDRRHRATSTSAWATYWISSSDSRLENGRASVEAAIRSVTGKSPGRNPNVAR